MNGDDRPELRDVLARPWRLDLVWLVLPAALAGVGFGLLPLRSWDYWWHLSVGRLVNYWGAVPAANHFLYTLPAHAPSYIQPWLADLLLYGLHSVGSVHAGLLARNVLAAGAFAALTATAVRRAQSVAAGSVVTLAALAFALRLMEVRPRLFAWPIYLGLLGVGYAIRTGRLRPIFTSVFPVATALWANLHGSFLLGPATAAAFAVGASVDVARGESERPRWAWWSGAAGLSVAASLANPRGPALFEYVYSLAADDLLRSTVTEWWPTTPTSPPLVGPLFYLTVAAVVGLLWRRRRSVDPADACLLAGTGLLAALQVRAMLWWGLTLPFAAAPYAAGLLTDRSDSPPDPGVQRAHGGAAVFLVLAALAVQPTLRWRVDWASQSRLFDVRERPPLEGVVPAETPFEAVEVLGRYADPPRVFHDHRYAGFILFHLTGPRPARTVFVDHRVELPSPRVWRLYRDVNRRPNVWRGVFEQYDVGAAILSRRHQSDLIERIAATDGWSPLRGDDRWTLLVPD